MATPTPTWSAAPWTTGRADRKADGAKLYVRCARHVDGAPAGVAVAHVLAAPGRGEQLDAEASDA